MGVVVVRGHVVQAQQRLVDGLLQLQSGLDGLQSRGPFILVGLGYVLQDDLSTTLVLILHELHRVLALLVGILFEELEEAAKGLVFSVEEVSLCKE